MTAAPTNGNADWKELAATFLARHVDTDGKRLPFTIQFNSSLEALISEESVPLVWRMFFWIIRFSWGNYSDHVVSTKGGYDLGQKDAALALRVDKQRISECVAELEALGYVIPDGRKLKPADNPASLQLVRHYPDKKRKKGEEFYAWWAVRNSADYRKFKIRAKAYFASIKIRNSAYKEYALDRTLAEPIPIYEEPKTSLERKPAAASSSSSKKKADDDAPKPPTSNFSQDVIAEFVRGGKPSPTQKQIRTLQHAIPNTPEALAGFIPFLREKMPRTKHPGLLPNVAQEFNERWPVLLASAQTLTDDEPKCRACGEPLGDGLALQGCHHECYEQAQGKAKRAGGND